MSDIDLDNIPYSPRSAADNFNARVDGGWNADDAFIVSVAVIAGWKVTPLALEHMADLQALVLAYAKRTDKPYLLTSVVDEK